MTKPNTRKTKVIYDSKIGEAPYDNVQRPIKKAILERFRNNSLFLKIAFTTDHILRENENLSYVQEETQFVNGATRIEYVDQNNQKTWIKFNNHGLEINFPKGSVTFQYFSPNDKGSHFVISNDLSLNDVDHTDNTHFNPIRKANVTRDDIYKDTVKETLTKLLHHCLNANDDNFALYNSPHRVTPEKSQPIANQSTPNFS